MRRWRPRSRRPARLGVGALAAVQSFGNLAASAVAGALWTGLAPRAFLYLGVMLTSAVALIRVWTNGLLRPPARHGVERNGREQDDAGRDELDRVGVATRSIRWRSCR